MEKHQPKNQILCALLLTLILPYCVNLYIPYLYLLTSILGILFILIIYEINSIEAEISALQNLFFGFKALSLEGFCLNVYRGKSL